MKKIFIGITEAPFNSTLSFWVEGSDNYRYIDPIIIDNKTLFCEIVNGIRSEFSPNGYSPSVKCMEVPIDMELINSLRLLADELESVMGC